MDRACENCRFCIYAHSMRGKDKPYCERHSEWIGDTLLCSKWEMVSVPKPQTNADRIRSMTDKELDKFLGEVQWDVANYCGGVTQKQEYPAPEQIGAWLDWLKEYASDDQR